MYILIKIYNYDGFIKIEIVDNGIGIKNEFKDYIFEMYFGINKNKGLGLGFYIVKEVVENIKGNIFLILESNIGSMFILIILNNYGI